MIRRTPCEYYLKYLLLHPDDYSLEDIQLTLREHQLDYPGDVPVKRLRDRIRRPAVFRPYDKRHSDTFKFLVSEGVYHLFHPDEHMRVAVSLLKRPRAKEVLEAMTLSCDPTKFVLYRLNNMGFNVGVKDFERYCFYFWNLNLVDRAEVAALIQLRVDSMAVDGDDMLSTLRYKAMKRASYNDPRVAAINSPVSPFTGMMTQMRLGYSVGRLDIATLLTRARESLVMRTVEASLDRGPMAARQSLDFSGGARNVHELLESLGTPDEDLQRNLMNLMLDTDKAPVPYVHELTGGDHTVDVQPTDKHVVE